MENLWKYNTTTGYWSLARQCRNDEAAAWLFVFQKDDPAGQFKLCPRKPKPLTGERGRIALP